MLYNGLTSAVLFSCIALPPLITFFCAAVNNCRAFKCQKLNIGNARAMCSI